VANSKEQENKKLAAENEEMKKEISQLKKSMAKQTTNGYLQ
jgi:cell division protein FtsB